MYDRQTRNARAIIYYDDLKTFIRRMRVDRVKASEGVFCPVTVDNNNGKYWSRTIDLFIYDHSPPLFLRAR